MPFPRGSLCCSSKEFVLSDCDCVALVLVHCRKLEITHTVHLRGSWEDFTLPKDGVEISGALINFLIAFWKKHAVVDEEVAAKSDPYLQNAGESMQQGLDAYFSNKVQKKFVEVDMVQAMTQANLLNLFHDDLWPACTAVRELATQLKTKRFAYSELKKFLPPSCDTFVQVVDPAIDPEAAAVKPPKGGRALDLATWQMAWDRYALAAVMVKMVDFHDAMRYKQASCRACLLRAAR